MTTTVTSISGSKLERKEGQISMLVIKVSSLWTIRIPEPKHRKWMLTITAETTKNQHSDKKEGKLSRTNVCSVTCQQFNLQDILLQVPVILKVCLLCTRAALEKDQQHIQKDNVLRTGGRTKNMQNVYWKCIALSHSSQLHIICFRIRGKMGQSQVSMTNSVEHFIWMAQQKKFAQVKRFHSI